MRYRELGKTGLMVSEIGFGTIPVLSGNVPVLPDYYSPDVDEAVDIMMHAYRLGCNLYDTAIPEEYGDAEYKLGVFAEKVGRDNIIISDKARFMDGNDMFREVMRSVETLGTTPDIYFVHQVDEKNEEETFSRYGAIDALCDLKKAGIIKYTGVATHYYSVAERAAYDDRVDVIQTSGNILERGIIDRIAEKEIFREKGLILNKVYAAGCLLNVFTPSELISGILHWPFSCALIGIGTIPQADAAMKEEFTQKYYPFEQVTEKISELFTPIKCTRCQRCVCPHGYEIHIMLRQYNYFHLGKKYWAMKKLRLNIDEVYENCRKCTDRPCMKDCPKKLRIPELIETIYEMTR
ncbi:aldo/keto reductase [Ruminococcus albus]|uniref:aldo/keto reductase n=1 Tax=Ruminococcus albus TaxID=1264 RepID=UPI000464CE84|nr:aldo/keto reductase [Ruminococcus albus]